MDDRGRGTAWTAAREAACEGHSGQEALIVRVRVEGRVLLGVGVGPLTEPLGRSLAEHVPRAHLVRAEQAQALGLVGVRLGRPDIAVGFAQAPALEGDSER